MLKRLPFYILIALGILAFKFYGEYDGSAIAHPEWIAGAGVACWLLAGVFIWLRGSRALQKENHTWQQKMGDLKANGEMIRVPAAECELKETPHAVEYIPQSGEVVSEAEEILREMMYLPNRQNPAGTTQSHQTYTTLIYRHKNTFTGSQEIFASKPIPKDKITLALYLDRQVTLLLYVSRHNRGEYHFDTDFIYNSL